MSISLLRKLFGMKMMSISFLLFIWLALFCGKFASCTRSPKINNINNSMVTNDVAYPNELKADLKPCRRHLKRVESFIFPPNFRPFIPVCDARGYYLPLQCHHTSGYCWCVNKNDGKLIPGSKKKGVVDCGMKDLKRPCERHLFRSRKLQSGGRRSVFLPNCSRDGFYLPMQCVKDNRYCWCVDKYGHEKRGTHAKGTVNCSKPNVKGIKKHATDVFSAKNEAEGPCLRYKRSKDNLIAGANRKQFDPHCDEEGFYAKKQCHLDYCWCSDRYGNQINGTKKEKDVDCELSALSGPTRPPRNRCFTERLKGLKSSIIKRKFVPLCSSDGSFEPLQCDGYKGYCWCVDKWGKEIANSRTKRTPNCFSKDLLKRERKRPCYQLKRYFKKLSSMDNIHIPVCERTGFFMPLQCSNDNKFCWCVNAHGEEIKGTLAFGRHDCPNRGINMMSVKTYKTKNGPCLRHKMKRERLVQAVRRNIFNPECDKDGYYDVKQCHGKYCWCSDHTGKLIRGTRKKGHVDCSELSNPKVKPCLANRLKALKISIMKKPYVPQCEANGDFTPLQCNIHTGVCWCVNKHGEEHPGSRTKRTPNCFAEAFNTIKDAPCHILKSYISKLPIKSKVNVPVCEGNGFFQQAQCSKNGAYCWCVHHDGTEVEGSITFGEPTCHEKPAPAVPILRGPCEEHLAQVTNLRNDDRKDVYSPVCDNDGYYAPHQCDKDTTWCWCVDRFGSMIQGTRTKGAPVCEKSKPCLDFKKKTKNMDSEVNDVYDAVCTEEGYFAPLQCNVLSGKCWCVNIMGKPEIGTASYLRPYCGKQKRKCEYERRAILSEDKSTQVPPSCDVHGYYSRLQCHHLTSQCWCADRYGKEIAGTRIKGIPECDQIPRPCDEHASRTSDYDYVFGVYVPQCDSEGYYDKIQCHEKTNVCWCSNKLGVEIPGTKTSGKPNCLQ